MMTANFNGMQSGPGGFNPQSFIPMQGFQGGLPTGMDPAAAAAMGMHNPGAIRRGGGGGRFNNHRSGPYDRRGGRGNFSRGNSDGSNPFTMGPPGMGMRMGSGGMGFVAQGGGGGGGKWGDGAGGRLAMAPTEAIQGRSIKSYEDLDAQPSTGGGGTGAPGGTANTAELDY